MTVDKNEHMRGGEGVVTVRHFSDKEEMLGKGRMFATMLLPPGASIGKHQHVNDFEVYVIQKGRAKVMDPDNGEAFLEPGDMMLCRDSEFHAIENAGEDELEVTALILYTTSPID